MVRVLALLPVARAQKRLGAALALRERAWSPSIQFVSTWTDATSLTADRATDLLAFDPYASGRLADRPAARFKEQFPSCVLVGYGNFQHGYARDVLALARAGVQEIATVDVDDSPEALAKLLDTALRGGTLGSAQALLEQRMPASLRNVLPGILFHGTGCPTPAEAARRCHCHPKTLRAHLRAARLPSPARLIAWTRLIHACHLLQDTGRSVEKVALVLGFSSANNLRNQLFRHAGVRPTEVRQEDGLKSVLARFEAVLKPSPLPQHGSRECDPVFAECASTDPSSIT